MEVLILSLVMPALFSIPGGEADPHAGCTEALHERTVLLLCTLEGGDHRERRQAALQLGSFQSGCPTIVSTLIKAVQDEKRSVRREAVRALGRIGRPAIPATRSLFDSMKKGRVCPCTVDAALKRILPYYRGTR